MYREADVEYLENVINLLEEEKYEMDCSKEDHHILITIQKESLHTETTIKETTTHAEVAEKIVTTFKWWVKAISDRIATEAVSCGGYLAFNQMHPHVRALYDELDKTEKKLTVIRLRWYARERAEHDKNAFKPGN